MTVKENWRGIKEFEAENNIFSLVLFYFCHQYMHILTASFADKLKTSGIMLFQNDMNFCICTSWMIVLTAVYVFLETWKERIHYRYNVEIVVNESSYLDFLFVCRVFKAIPWVSFHRNGGFSPLWEQFQTRHISVSYFKAGRNGKVPDT